MDRGDLALSRPQLRLLAGTTLATWLTLAAAAHAETAQPQPGPSGAQGAAPSAAANSGTVGEIVVTAQRRSEAAQKVPISIDTVTGKVLQQQNVTTVVDLPKLVPALRLNYAGTFVLPTIRGVGSIVALPGLTQNIATYVDGYYIPTPSASNFDLVNINNVSVLKGPQGTLFGANATGGAIMITTLEPSATTSGLLRATYGSFNDARGDFYGTTGLAPGVAVNLGASYEHSNGYTTNLVDGNDHVGALTKYTIRPKLLIEPSDKVRFTLGYEHTYADDPTTQLVVPRNGITVGRFVPGTIITDNSPRYVALDNPGYARPWSNAITLTSEFNFNWAKLTSYTGYRKDNIDQALDYDASSAPINFSNWTVRDTTLTQEFDLASHPGGRLSWVLGAFFMRYTDAYHYFTGGHPIFTSQNITKSYAGFGDATYEVAPKLYLTFGARYSEDLPDVAFNLLVANLAEAGGVKFHNLSVRSVIRYEPTPDSSVYASFSQGYRAGGLPGSAFSLTPVKPEHIDAIEFGYKIAQGPVRANLAAFHYDYSDIQVTSYGAGGQSITVNAAGAKINGIDGDITYEVTRDLSFTFNGSFVDATYGSFNNALAQNLDTDPLSATFGTIVPMQVNATGNRVERTPRFAASAAVNYGFDLAGGRMALNANANHSGYYYFDPAHQFNQPAYTLLNLRATWTDPSGKYDVSAFGKNVTNRKYFLSTFIDPYAARAVYAAPAEWGGSVTYHF
jgi:iron complex outermembrane receptor protein